MCDGNECDVVKIRFVENEIPLLMERFAKQVQNKNTGSVSIATNTRQRPFTTESGLNPNLKAERRGARWPTSRLTRF